MCQSHVCLAGRWPLCKQQLFKFKKLRASIVDFSCSATKGHLILSLVFSIPMGLAKHVPISIYFFFLSCVPKSA